MCVRAVVPSPSIWSLICLKEVLGVANKLLFLDSGGASYFGLIAIEQRFEAR